MAVASGCTTGWRAARRYRHFLRFIGVPPDDLQWTIGPVDEPNITSHVYTLPDGVRAAPGAGRCPMLVASELDAIYSPPRPRRYHPVDGPIARLFPTSVRSSGSLSVPRACSRHSISSFCDARRGNRTMDRARPDRRIRPLHGEICQGAQVVPVCVALA